MLTNNHEAKTKCKFNSTKCNSNQKWNNETPQFKCKNVCMRQKDYSKNPSRCTCESGKYPKSIADTSMIVCDEIISVMDIVSTKTTKTIAANASINYHNKKDVNLIAIFFTQFHC